MPWRCRMIPEPGFEVGPDGLNGFQRLRVGDMWHADHASPERLPMILAPQHAGRRPLIVRLPGTADFAVLGPEWRDGRPQPSGWQVEGEAPVITVRPSIHLRGVYHGYLTGGEIGDDIDGRRYDEDGILIR